MIGTLFVGALIVLAAVLVIAVIRNVLVTGLTAIAGFIAVLLETALKMVIFMIDTLSARIVNAWRGLRDVHGERDADYARFWDIFLPMLFLGLLGILVVCDYQLFAARIGPLLGLTSRPTTSDQVLNLALGALYVVTLFVIGYALSDAYGHSPAGRSLTFGKLNEKQRGAVTKVLWAAAAVLLIATLALAIWTVEVTVIGQDDNFTAGLFLVTFSVLAVFATAVAVIPALIGVLSVITLVLEALRVALWLVGMVFWLVLSLVDKLVGMIVAVLIDIPAKLGGAIIGFVRKDNPMEPWIERKEITPYVSHNPLLGPVDAQVAPVTAAAIPVNVIPTEPVVAETAAPAPIRLTEATTSTVPAPAPVQTPVAERPAAPPNGTPRPSQNGKADAWVHENPIYYDTGPEDEGQ